MRLTDVLTSVSTSKLKVSVRLRSDLHIGTGSGGRSWVDRAVVRDATGRPLIPGSHMKGVMRDNTEQLAALLEHRICRAPRAENMCETQNDACIVCKLYGNPKLPSSLIFSDMLMQERYVDPALVVSIRNNVSIDRHRKVAKDGRLFNSEVVSSAVSFAGEILITRCLTDEEKRLLKLSASFTERLGGSKSTGMGVVTVELSEVSADD